MEIKIALAGNPNCGKTTLFNDLTGSNQYVGNWPGVTVEKKEGRLKGQKGVVIQDLPGIYSLSPYTQEEVVSRNYLVNDKPDAILNIVDGTNIERNLYLTTQLLETGLPMVIAVNMIDLVRKNGDQISLPRLGEALGCGVVEMSALKGEGGMAAAEAAVAAAQKGRTGELPHVFTGSVEHALAHIEESITGIVNGRYLRWYAIKIFERDSRVLAELRLNDELTSHLEEHIRDCETELDDDAESIITNQRYTYINRLVSQAVVKSRQGHGHLSISDRVDQIVTNRILALPIFLLIMAGVYYVAVTSLGTIVTDWTNDTLFGAWIQPGVQSLLEHAGVTPWVISMIVDGIIGGLAAPIGFAPQMAILFLFLSIMEDCGYMARVAFIMDRIFRRFGLSGKSFIPLLISSGCGVPAIMSTRTIENENDRRLTMMTTTFIPCGAKLPVIALIAGYIMNNAWWVSFLMYVMGIAAVVCSGIILKKTRPFRGEAAPFVMELPAYHIPGAKTVGLHVWERVWAFLKKAGTILFLCCMVMWLLGSFGFAGGKFLLVADVEGGKSLLEYIGGFLAPLFAPLGFGTWQAVSATLSGFVAKEGIVSTMAVIAGIDEGAANLSGVVSGTFFGGSALAGMTFLIFNLLDSPCLAAISTMAKEMNSRRWTAFALCYQNLFAYCVCLMVYQLGSFFAGGGFTVGTFFGFGVVALFLFLLFRPDPSGREGRLSGTPSRMRAGV